MKKTIVLTLLIATLVLFGCQKSEKNAMTDVALVTSSQGINQKTPKIEAEVATKNGVQIYTNKSFNFSFELPASCEVNDGTGTTVTKENIVLALGMCQSSGDDAISINVIDEPDFGKAVMEIVAGKTLEKEDKIKIGDTKGKIVYLKADDESGRDARWIFVEKKAKTYALGLTYDEPPYSEYFEKIVQSFAFLN